MVYSIDYPHCTEKTSYITAESMDDFRWRMSGAGARLLDNSREDLCFASKKTDYGYAVFCYCQGNMFNSVEVYKFDNDGDFILFKQYIKGYL